jgi:hypothetical protein
VETFEQIKARAEAALPGAKLTLVAMFLPSAAEVATLRAKLLTLFNQLDQALVKTDCEQRSQLKTPEHGKPMRANNSSPSPALIRPAHVRDAESRFLATSSKL